MPKKGFKNITVSDAVHAKLKRVAESERLSMAALVTDMLGALYPEHPDPVGAGEEREK